MIRVFIQKMTVVLVLSVAAGAEAQVLLKSHDRRPAEAGGASAGGAEGSESVEQLRGVSLLLVEPPRPRTIEVHDKITIIISELSRQSSSQTLDTKDDASFSAKLSKFPDLMKFLELNLTNTGGSPIAEAGWNGNSKFKGEGKYNRDDRFTDRVTATVIDVKPNGVVVLEARREITKDEESQTMVLSGECRRDDVTDANTVLSNQLSDLTLKTTNTGRVKDAATKGLIPRLFEGIFNW